MKEIRFNSFTDEEINNFLSELEPKKYYYADFYNKFIAFIEKSNLFLESEEAEEREERRFFEKAKELGYIGYDVLYSTTKIDEFKNKISSLTALSDYLFYISYTDEDENKICLTDIWSKWNERPP